MMRWQWISELCVKHGWKVGAELGVASGGCTGHLLDRKGEFFVPGLRMIAVDVWAPTTPAYAGYRHDHNHVKFMERVLAFDDGACTVIRDMTVDAALKLSEEVDFVFIDADHTYRGVLSDIQAWRPKVRGAVLGHDWVLESVRQAVRDCFPDSDIVEGPDACWGVWL